MDVSTLDQQLILDSTIPTPYRCSDMLTPSNYGYFPEFSGDTLAIDVDMNAIAVAIAVSACSSSRLCITRTIASTS
jgi:hypothetical protein